MNHAFTVWEAEIAVFQADTAGRPLSRTEYIGACVESVGIEESFETVELTPHGAPYKDGYHADERHKITIGNVWMLQRYSLNGVPAARMPQFRRNQKYCFVIVWYDALASCWVKRSYFGVMGDTRSLSGEVVAANLSYNARYYIEQSGLGEKPSFAPANTGIIRYVSEDQEIVDLYQYDFDTGTLTAYDSSLLTGRAQIAFSSGAWTFTIEGDDALVIDASGMTFKTLTAQGGSFSLGGGSRLEFWQGLTRVATLTKSGELAVANAVETTVNPALADDFEFKNGSTWLGSLAKTGAYTVEYSEYLS